MRYLDNVNVPPAGQLNTSTTVVLQKLFLQLANSIISMLDTGIWRGLKHSLHLILSMWSAAECTLGPGKEKQYVIGLLLYHIYVSG